MILQQYLHRMPLFEYLCTSLFVIFPQKNCFMILNRLFIKIADYSQHHADNLIEVLTWCKRNSTCHRSRSLLQWMGCLLRRTAWQEQWHHHALLEGWLQCLVCSYCSAGTGEGSSLTATPGFSSDCKIR